MPRPPIPASQCRSEGAMSTLVAIAYPDKATADEVVATLGRLQKEHLDLARGRRRRHARRQGQGQAAPDQQARGRRRGGRRALGRPDRPDLLRAAARHGRRRGDRRGDRRADRRRRRRQLHEGPRREARVRRRGADRARAQLDDDKVLPEIAHFGGEVIQTSLDNEAEERLRHALEMREAALPSEPRASSRLDCRLPAGVAAARHRCGHRRLERRRAAGRGLRRRSPACRPRPG